MNILYGVQGTGNGHISRAREMARAFQAHGVSVDFMFSGRQKSQYFDMDIFGDFKVNRGLTFITEGGRVNHLKTVTRNNLAQCYHEIKCLNLSHYDVLLNDFEPVSAWAAERQGIPSIGISHQCAFLCQVPMQGQGLKDRFIVNYFAPTQYHLGLHWYHFQQNILPPIIRSTTLAQVSDQGEILIYLPFEPVEDILDLLQRFSKYRFNVYHPTCKTKQQRGHVLFFPLSREGFHQHLLSCSGVMTNGGFELPSEALAIGKKLLLKPLDGQFEQQSNMMTLELMGIAQRMTGLCEKTLAQWLDTVSPGVIDFPNVADHIVNWVMRGDWHNHQSLREDLWSQVRYPKSVQSRIDALSTVSFQESPTDS